MRGSRCLRPPARRRTLRTRWGGAVRAAAAKPDLVAAALKQGIAVNVRDGGALAAFQKAEVEKWANVARTAKVAAE